MGEDTYRVEPAKSNRSACKVCKTKIEKDQLRFGTYIEMGSGGSYHWRCFDCLTAKQCTNVIAKLDAIECISGWSELSGPQQLEFRTAFEAKAGGKPMPKAKAKAEEKPKAAAKTREAPKAKAKGRAPPPKPAKPMPSEKEQHDFLDKAKNFDFDDVKELIKENPLYVNVQPAGRWSALHQAVEAEDEDAIKFLLDHGADLTATTKDGKTPKDIAKKDSIKALLGPPVAKRKAGLLRATASGNGQAATSTEGGAKKPKTNGANPVLYLFKPCSATELGEQMNDWLDEEGEESICDGEVQHKHIKDAPAEARKLAERMQRSFGDAGLPAGETDVEGRVIVIAEPGDDPKEACFRALGIKEEYMDHATLSEKDMSVCKKFCGDDDDDDTDEDDDDGKKTKATTKLMAESLKNCFDFSLDENVNSAPRLWGGYCSDGSIVGVLGMRVWT